jgi:PPOX class probable F420-dependent enzyme
VALDDRAREFLDEQRFAVLGTINPDGTIQQTVMWYLLRGDQIVMNTARGRKKDRNVLRDRRVSICVEDGYRYVTVAGEVEVVEDRAAAQADIAALAERCHGAERTVEMVRDGFGQQERISLLLPIADALAYGFGDKE